MLSPQTENILKIPVMPGSPLIWIIDKYGMQEGVFYQHHLQKW
jgi:hypothetical protein